MVPCALVNTRMDTSCRPDLLRGWWLALEAVARGGAPDGRLQGNQGAMADGSRNLARKGFRSVLRCVQAAGAGVEFARGSTDQP